MNFHDMRWQQRTKTGKYEAEGWRIRKDGSRFWAGVVINAIKGPGGELLGICQDNA